MLTPRRDIAIVFQDYGKALLPWRTAAGNVSLALEASGIASSQRAARIDELLKKVGLPGHAGKYPAEMSGGMQQRLQIARCLAQEPKALLMDEPFGALDAMTRQGLQDEVLSLVEASKATVHFRHPRSGRGDLSGRPRHRSVAASRPHRHRAQDRSAAAARSADDTGRSRVSAAATRTVRFHQGFGSMIPERAKALLLPVAALVLLEIWARAIHLQSDSLAPPSAVAAALVEAFKDGSVLTATRDTLISAFAGLGDRRRRRPCARHCLGDFPHLRPADGGHHRGDPSHPVHCAAADRPDRVGFRIPHGDRDRRIRLCLADPDPEPRRGRRNRAAADRGIARAAAFSGRSGPQDHHSGGAAADFSRVPPRGRHRPDCSRHGRNRDQPDRTWRRDHDGAAGAAARPDAGLSVVDRRDRICAEHRPPPGAASTVRTRGTGGRRHEPLRTGLARRQLPRLPRVSLRYGR